MILHSWISPCRIWPTTFKLPALFLIDYPAHPRSAAWVHWAALHHSILGLKTNTPAWQTLQGVCISHHIQNEQWSLENITRRPSSRGRNSWLVTAERLLYSVTAYSLNPWFEKYKTSYLQCLDRAMNGRLWCEEKEPIQQRGRPPSQRNTALYSKHTDLLLLRPWDVARGLPFRKNGGRREYWMGRLF